MMTQNPATAELRAQFDPVVGLIVQETDTGRFHPTRASLSFAATIVAIEGLAALPEAERVIRRVLRDQERQPGNIHQGGFKWMDEDRGVTDLNAVQFALEQLLPFYQDYSEHFSDSFRDELLETFRLAAAELERLNVRVFYTNIALLDTLNTVLAAQILGDARLAERGRRRFDEWIAFTNRSGAVYEYNSPTYAPVDIGALAKLAERADDPAIRNKAQLMEERLWLHAAVHYHHQTAQLAGPHSRAYHNDVTGGVCGIKRLLFSQFGDERLLRKSSYATQRQGIGNPKADKDRFHLPDYVRRLFLEKPERYSVAETANIGQGVDLYTFMTPIYALGTASTGNYPQSNQVICYYRPAPPRDLGVLFARYIVNEKSFGSHYHATDRSTANNLNDEGRFWGVQHESKSIALYGLLPQSGAVHSLKAEVYLLDADQIDMIWVNDTPAGSLPLRLQPHDTLTIADGDTYLALRPLEPSRLGDEAPIILQERSGELVLSIYNYYQGEPKGFWEYANLSGPFYNGNIRSGFILEVGDRNEYGDFETFRAHILRGAIADTTEGNIRRVRYASGADLIEILVDLSANQLVERRINGVIYQPPMLQSPTAVQGTGTLAAGAATLACDTAPAWLIADDAHACWAATNPSDALTIWELTTPAATVRSAAFGCGRMVVSGGSTPTVDVLAVQQEAPLRITAAHPPSVLWNGLDRSAECFYDRLTGDYVVPC